MALPSGASRLVYAPSGTPTVGGIPPNPTTSLPLQSQSRPLRIAIVGAGIGGLSAAVALRRNGHEVYLYEQSGLVNDVGAAVHLAPNANGVLRRWGILAEQLGANPMDHIVDYLKDGQLRKYIDLRGPNSRWQHPWHLVYRVSLHTHLKKLATSDEGVGTPARLHTQNRVVSVNPEQGTLILRDGTRVTADLIIGADGIYSTTRRYIKDTTLFSSGKAAFRFLLPCHIIAADPVTASVTERKNSLFIWYGDDRRIVVYPCDNNQLLNFVCIHPDTESQATMGEEWGKRGSVERMLHIFQDFDVTVRTLLSKVEPSALSVFPLLDMEKLPTWAVGKLVLLGDAAHPFTPHQGQGAGQAIEDAAALSVVLPRGTSLADIPIRLKLYEEIRYERAHAIQEYSRLAGQDWVNGEPRVDMMAFTNYNFGHDVIDHASITFQRWQWSQDAALIQRYRGLPTPFGPFLPPPHPKLPLPNVTQIPRTPVSLTTDTLTATITFKTSRTYLETLLPPSGLRFRDPDTVATASFIARRLSHDGGTAKETFQIGLYFHGVQHIRPDGVIVNGAYLAVLFDSASALDQVTSDVDCAAKVRCHVFLEMAQSRSRLVASWRGVNIIEAGMSDLKLQPGGGGNHGVEEGNVIIVYQPGAFAYMTMPSSREGTLAVTERAEIKMHARDWEQLPTLHHVAAVMADIPVYSVVGGSVVVGTA